MVALASRHHIALWLLICCAMVFVMALLGAITRLTESGLSITEWQPVTGALPPLSETEWNKAFDDYKSIPQYQVLNRGMTLAAFKGIYFWEWLHRLWGRLIGLVFALPFIYFSVRKKFGFQPRLDCSDDKRLSCLGFRLLIIFVLGGLQGFIGWFMVKSGLSLRTSVSPYRLAMHLDFALLLYALLLWTALDLLDPRGPLQKNYKNSARFGWATLGLLVVTMTWGAFVAGLRAGEVYNTWPLMDGQFLPAASLAILPTWHNFFENTALVQFIHRWLAPATASAILLWVVQLWLCHESQKERRWIAALGIMAVTQVALGLTVLLTHVEIVIATCHQAGAIMLLSLLLINMRRLKRPV